MPVGQALSRRVYSEEEIVQLIEAMCFMTNDLLNKLQRMQNRALKIIFRLNRTFPTKELHQTAGVLMLDQRREMHLLNLMYKRSKIDQSGPYLAGAGGGSCPPGNHGKKCPFASRCPFSYAKSSSSAGCPSEPRTAPPPHNFRLHTAMPVYRC